LFEAGANETGHRGTGWLLGEAPWWYDADCLRKFWLKNGFRDSMPDSEIKLSGGDGVGFSLRRVSVLISG
jgi:hypothetical protein